MSHKMNLKLENISKSFNNKMILNKINIKIEKGEIYTILGNSGAGKTTILKLISGILKPDNGRIYKDDKDITDMKTELRKIPFIFQSPLLFPHLNVRENIGFGLKIRKISKKDIVRRVDYLANLMGIEKLLEHMPKEVSGGQQQRVAIARALAPDSQLILMDEPFSSLDSKLREDMALLIKDIQTKLGITIVFVTHNIEESFLISSRVAVLKDGEILQEDTPKNSYDYPINPFVGRFMGDINLIRGKVREGAFYCDFGNFKANAKNGEYYLLIRPHQLSIKNTNGIYEIIDIKYKGKSTKYFVKVKDKMLEVEVFSGNNYECGDKVLIEFPQSNLHFIRAD